MIGLERDRPTAIPTATVVEADEVKPLRRRVRAKRRDLAGAPQSSDDANDLGIRQAVCNDRCLRSLTIARVVITLVGPIFLTMLGAPATHRLARLRSVSFDPLATVGPTHVAIRMRHARPSTRQAPPWQ
jgi:hypothetical protein